MAAVYGERRVSAFIQERLRPTETGRYSFAHAGADLVKLLIKEDIVPAKADPLLFRIAPLIIFTSVFAGFAFLPLSPTWAGASVASGLFFLLAIISLDVIGIIIAGWSSHNKY